MDRVAQFASSLRSTKGENVKVVVGVKSIRVITDQKALDGFRLTLRPEDIISYGANLTEISVRFPPEVVRTRGVLAKITTELALNDVNLFGTVCNIPENIFLVEEADASRGFACLQRMLKEEGAIPKQSRAITGVVSFQRPNSRVDLGLPLKERLDSNSRKLA
jgi:hypothetical protein